MALLVACLVGFLRFDGTARWLVIASGAVVEVVEAAGMIWWSRRRRSDIGLEAMIGRTGRTICDCRPRGRLRIDGEIWSAVCETGCPADTSVEIVAVHGLELTVRPIEDGRSTTPG